MGRGEKMIEGGKEKEAGQARREGSEKERLGKETRREMCCQEVMTKEDKM